MRKRSSLVLAVANLVLLLVAPGKLAHARATEVYQPPDCGINSLYILFTLQGRPVTTPAIEAALPERHPEGYSMAELQRAARRLGVPLQGERCHFAELPHDRPFILYTTTHRPGGGHFFTARFIGASKTLIQTLEPPYAPSIIASERFNIAGDPDFFVLRPITFVESIPNWAFVATCLSIAVAIWVLLRRWQWGWLVGRSLTI